MTDQPPDPPEPPDDDWVPDDDWTAPGDHRPGEAADRPTRPDLTIVPPLTPGTADDGSPVGTEIPWGNSADELLTESMRQLGVLTDQVSALHQLVTADREDDAGRGPGRYHRYRYERHPAKVAAAAHAELGAWVSWAVATYQLHDLVPACWERHDGLAEELAGFYVAWCNVWSDEGSYDAGPIWHDQLHRATARWSTWLAGTRCGPTCHADPALDARTHTDWRQRSADSGGTDWRLQRTRSFGPPRPAPRKKRPPAGGQPAATTITGRTAP